MIECELKLGRDNEQSSIRSGDIVLCSVKPENDGAAPDRYADFRCDRNRKDFPNFDSYDSPRYPKPGDWGHSTGA